MIAPTTTAELLDQLSAPVEELDAHIAAAGGAERAALQAELSWRLRGQDAERSLILYEVARERAFEGDADPAREAMLIARARVLLVQGMNSMLASHNEDDGGFGRRVLETLGAVDDRVAQARAYNLIAHSDIEADHLDSAVDAIVSGIAALGTPHGAGHNALGLLHNNRGRIHFERGELRRARLSFTNALDSFRRDGGHSRAEGLAWMNIGNVCSEMADLAGALEAYRESLGCQRRVGHRRGIAFSLINMAGVLTRMERPEEALECLEESRRCREPEETESAMESLFWRLRSEALADVGRFGEALDELESVLGQTSLTAVEHSRMVHAKSYVLEKAGRVEEALACAKESQRELGDHNRPAQRVGSAIIAGRALIELGEYAAAVEELEGVVPVAETSEVRFHFIGVLECLARAYEASGETEQALEILKRLRPLEKEIHDSVASGRLEHLSTLHELERAQQREVHLEEARAELDARVEKRTLELRDANEQLRRALEDKIHEQERRQRVEEELRQSQRLEAVGRFAGGMAHDFNNLLTIIQAYASILQRGGDGATLQAIGDQLMNVSERGAELTSQLLAFTRERAYESAVVDLNELLAEIRPLIERLVPAHVELEMELEPTTPPVEIDPAQLKAAVFNFVANARDAIAGETGTIRIATGSERQVAEVDPPGEPCSWLEVADSGCGMDDDTRQLVFDPFFTTKPPGKGTGLGLSMAYGIVQQAGGAIRVRTEPGVGSRFKVLLPSTEKPREPVVRERASSGDGSPAGEVVLVVEDDAEIRDLVGEHLRQRGYEVISVGDGVEALEILRESPEGVDVVVTDAVMPRMGGAELVARMQELELRVPTLLMSGYRDHFGSTTGDGDPSSRVVPKPFTMPQLESEIASLLDRHRG